MSDEELKLGELEKTLEDLEALVVKLEAGDMPLNDALVEFERGIRLSRQCQAVLKEAEQKIEILLTEREEPEPFEAE